MGLPEQVKKLAKQAEDLIERERTFMSRLQDQMRFYLDGLEAEIKPILESLEREKRGHDLPFETALACLKDGYHLTNDRFKALDERIFIRSIDDGFLLSYHDGGATEWMPSLVDIFSNDWCFWRKPDEQDGEGEE